MMNIGCCVKNKVLGVGISEWGIYCRDCLDSLLVWYGGV